MNAIVVVDKQWAIGKNNDLLFRLPLDLKNNFRRLTINKVVVMGANTFDSLPKGALPNRTNIVLNNTGKQYENATTVCNLEELFELLKQYNADDVFVIGGGMVYNTLLPYCAKAYVTCVDADGQGTVFFPNLDKLDNWQCVDAMPNVVDNGYNTQLKTYINSAVKPM